MLPEDTWHVRGQKSLKTLRHLILILLFAGLVSLEIWHGIFRVNTLTRRERDDALEAIRRGQAERARTFNENLRAEREHAGYLVKVPGVRALLRAEPAAEDDLRKRLWDDLLPYHKSFWVIDSMSLFDTGGRERFRMIRQGGGVAGVSADLLGQPEMVESIRSMVVQGSDEVALSRLEIESERVYVPESKRQVLRYAALVRDRQPLGVLVLTSTRRLSWMPSGTGVRGPPRSRPSSTARAGSWPTRTAAASWPRTGASWRSIRRAARQCCGARERPPMGRASCWPRPSPRVCRAGVSWPSCPTRPSRPRRAPSAASTPG